MVCELMGYYMSDDNTVIKRVEINKRINDGNSTFTVEFNTPLHPDEFQVGMPFEFIIDNGTNNNDFIVFRGIIEKIDRDEQNQNRIYGITGRDEGRLLTRQPFHFECEALARRKYSYIDILGRILEDTDLKIGNDLSNITGSV